MHFEMLNVRAVPSFFCSQYASRFHSFADQFTEKSLRNAFVPPADWTTLFVNLLTPAKRRHTSPTLPHVTTSQRTVPHVTTRLLVTRRDLTPPHVTPTSPHVTTPHTMHHAPRSTPNNAHHLRRSNCCCKFVSKVSECVVFFHGQCSASGNSPAACL